MMRSVSLEKMLHFVLSILGLYSWCQYLYFRTLGIVYILWLHSTDAQCKPRENIAFRVVCVGVILEDSLVALD